MKLDTNEWEATVDSWRMFPNYDMIDYDRIRIDDIKTFIHQQLQKANQDWLREEIVKLGVMKKEIVPIQYEPNPINVTMAYHEQTLRIGYNQAIQTIIDRYQSELDQDNN